MTRSVREIRLSRRYDDGWAAELEGRFVGPSAIRPGLLVGGGRPEAGGSTGRSTGGPAGEDVDVLRPDGTLLLALRCRVLPEAVCRLAWGPLLKAAVPSHNRGSAAGGRYFPVKKDGTVSRTLSSEPVLSGIMGYADRDPPRFRGCRETAFTAREVAAWDDCQPFLRAVNAVFRAECPDRYAAQRAVIEAADPSWRIAGTVFSTVTVNRNFQTAVHKDAGDLKEGFGVMAVLTRGRYEGGTLVFPQYGVGADVRDRDVLLADVHEWHANTPLIGEPGRFDRVSVVAYCRAHIVECGTPEEESRRARD
jgi:hypothetical protein